MYNSTSNITNMPWNRQPVVLYEQTSIGHMDAAQNRLCSEAENAARFAGAFSIRSILSPARQPQTSLVASDRFRQPPTCSYQTQSSLVCCDDRASSPPPIDMVSNTGSPIQHFGDGSISSCSLVLNSSNAQDRIVNSMAEERPRAKKSNKRSRTIFAPYQLQRLEKAFERQQYVAGEERRLLATGLNLTETQVKVWFQNRRIRFRKLRLKTPIL